MNKTGFEYYPYKVTEILYHDEVILFYEDFDGRCHWPFKNKKRNLQFIKNLKNRVAPVILIYDWGRITIWEEDRILWHNGAQFKLVEDLPPKKTDKPFSKGTVFHLGQGRKMIVESVHPPVPTLLDYTMQYGEDNSPTSTHYTAYLKRYLKGEI